MRAIYFSSPSSKSIEWGVACCDSTAWTMWTLSPWARYRFPRY